MIRHPHTSLLAHISGRHGDPVRNIKEIRRSQVFFDDLSERPEDWNVAIAAEAAAYIPSKAPRITRQFDYGAVVTCPLVNFNAKGKRYADGLDCGERCGALDVETAV